jgi:hypothetical protein
VWYGNGKFVGARVTVQDRGPRAGRVETITLPQSSSAAQNRTDGHEIALTGYRTQPAQRDGVAYHDRHPELAPAGRVETNRFPELSPATHKDRDGHEIANSLAHEPRHCVGEGAELST